MAGAFEGVRVRGLRELQRDFKKMSKDLSKELQQDLKDVAEPVRVEAAQLAVDNISHIGERWSEMRIGVTTRVVYVAPKARRRRGSPRPNLAPLLLAKAMQPALQKHEGEIVERLDVMLGRWADEKGF